jgi:hypothetical protein
MKERRNKENLAGTPKNNASKQRLKEAAIAA